MTIFRRLREVGYRTSYTHRGRYYTLAEVPDFDDWGLWFHGEVGFSRAGTLKETTVVQVEQAPDGRTHAELSQLLRVRVHNVLLELVRQRRVGREPYRGSFLYVSADPARAGQQLERRQELTATVAEALRVATDEEVVEILVEALRAAPEVPPPRLVSQRLMARGLRLEPRHVEHVYEEHGLVAEKKRRRPARGALGAEGSSGQASGALREDDTFYRDCSDGRVRSPWLLPTVPWTDGSAEDRTTDRSDLGTRRLQSEGDGPRLHRRVPLAIGGGGHPPRGVPARSAVAWQQRRLRRDGLRWPRALHAPPAA